MTHDDVLEHVEEIVAESGLLLVDTNLFQAGRRRVLRILVDRVGRVGLDECAGVSRKIANAIETLDLISSAYTLEVSSPGIGRALSTENDWIRCAGRKLEVKIESEEFVGILADYKDGLLTFEDGRIIDSGSVLSAREAI
ncbi:MAG: ribosome maturation factor RimP [Candidatus Fermentibacteria bacterium]|nr:ribosome maturation factor RimP [Candidatus Fermentibacteria bacterium]